MSNLVTGHDYGARDKRIACQTYSPVRRLEGVPHELFATYWRDVHGPLCSRLPGLGFYVQHHFSRTRSANLWPLAPGVKPMSLMLDGIVEIGFANTSEQARFIAASPILFGDELNLFGHDLAYNLPHGSKTYVDQQENGTPNGPDRLHRLHVHFNGGPGEVFRNWATSLAEHLAAAPTVRKLRLHLPDLYRNEDPQPPSPIVDHFASEERTSLAIIEIGFDTALSARAFFETATYQDTVAGQSQHVRNLGVFLVSGMYTYVRDGMITMAGLRGSRQAEIIEEIGAANQTSADVVRLFAPAIPS